jgi:hypothetical protein
MKAECENCRKLLSDDEIIFTYVAGWDMVANCEDCYTGETDRKKEAKRMEQQKNKKHWWNKTVEG